MAKVPDFWTAVKSYDVLKYDNLLSYVEGVIQLFVILTDKDISTKSAIAAIMLYAKTLVKDKSLISTIGDYVESLFVTPQSEGDTFIDAVRMCRTNWKLFKSNKLFAKVASLLTLLVSLGFCEATSFEFSIGSMKVVEAKTFDVQMDAFDLTDAVLDTVAFFIEGGYRCFQCGSLKPLLFDDYRVYQLEEEFINLSRMWDLQQNGNLLKMEGIQASEFDNRLEKCISSLKEMLSSFSGLDKKIITDKYNKLLQIKSDYVLSRLAGGTRRAPWTVQLFGKSGQGKTTVGETLIDGLLKAEKLPLDKTRRATVNASAKFMDTWKTDTLVAVLDDMCNEKSNFVERPPTRWVIDLCNNQTFYAPKAAVDSKGRVFVEPEIVLINTNVEHLCAFDFSNCPYSIQRRAHLVATVKAKSMFQAKHQGVECGLSPELVAKYYETHDRPPVEDLWDIDVKVAVQPAKLHEVASYTPFFYRGKKMVGISLNEFLEMNIDLFKKHRERQFEIVSRTEEQKDIKLCGIEGCCNIAGVCSVHSDYVTLPSHPASEPDPVEEEEDGVEVTSSARRTTFIPRRKFKSNKPRMGKQYGEQTAGAIHNTIETFKTRSDEEINALDDLATKGVYFAASYFIGRWDWLKMIPSPVLKYEIVQNYIKSSTKEIIIEKTNKTLTALFSLVFILSVTLMYVDWRLYPLVLFMWLSTSFFASTIYKKVEHAVIEEVTSRTKIMHPMLEKFKNDNYKYILGLSSLAFSIMALRCVYKSYMALKPAQGNLVSPSEIEVEERDKETNPYVEVYRRPLPIVGKGRTMTDKDLGNILDKNLLYGSIKVGEKVMKVNALMVTTNYMLLPSHYFENGKDTTMTCRRNNPDTLGGSYEVRLDLVNSIELPKSDLRLFYVAEGGSYKNILELLIDDFPTDHCFSMKYRQYDGTFLEARGMAKANPKCNNGKVFPGVDYFNLTVDTYKGLCGAVLYSKSIGCNITGIHVGGVHDTPVGCASIPRRKCVQDAMDELGRRYTCIKTAGDSEFPTTQFGVSFMTNDPLHYKSPVNFLPKESTISYHGSCMGKTTSHSDARVTPISTIVEEESGVPNKWQGPDFKPEWKGWQDCLANCSEPGKSLPYELLEHCVEDYISPLIEMMDKKPFWKKARPLNDEENLLGIPGRKFMDAIKKGTAVGYPLTGPKMKFLNELEATEEYPHNFEFTEEIMSIISDAEEKYAKYERVYPIAKACKKDEILPKKKCRIFYGNAIHLTWLIRKYFLPIIRFLQMNPLIAECAVGINCHSREWEQLHEYITKYENLIGGDYKKYDQKLPTQLIITAFKVMIELAKKCDYSEKDIRIMEAMVADVAYAYIAVNGDLISLSNGTHISGNSLTVIINGICGALNLRACFFTHNEWEKKFRDFVALSTYGDDNIGSTENCNFSIKLVSEFLSEYGQTYTMPNKTSELSDYLGQEDFEFLKRRTVYIPEIDCHVGALQEDSIFKSLHMYLRGKTNEMSEDEACALNIDTAIREFFNHGREVYEDKRRILQRIADRANIRAFCTEIDVPFDERAYAWREKYEPHTLEGSSDKTLKDPPRMTHGAEEAVEDVPSVLVTTSEQTENCDEGGLR